MGCGFVADIPHSVGKSFIVSMLVNHLRAAHRPEYLNLLELAYDHDVRGLGYLTPFEEATDGDALRMLAPDQETVNDDGKGHRRLQCSLCGFKLNYMGKAKAKSDESVRCGMWTHMWAFHREAVQDSVEVARGGWKARAT